MRRLNVLAALTLVACSGESDPDPEPPRDAGTVARDGGTSRDAGVDAGVERDAGPRSLSCESPPCSPCDGPCGPSNIVRLSLQPISCHRSIDSSIR